MGQRGRGVATFDGTHFSVEGPESCLHIWHKSLEQNPSSSLPATEIGFLFHPSFSLIDGIPRPGSPRYSGAAPLVPSLEGPGCGGENHHWLSGFFSARLTPFLTLFLSVASWRLARKSSFERTSERRKAEAKGLLLREEKGSGGCSWGRAPHSLVWLPSGRLYLGCCGCFQCLFLGSALSEGGESEKKTSLVRP